MIRCTFCGGSSAVERVLVPVKTETPGAAICVPCITRFERLVYDDAGNYRNPMFDESGATEVVL